MPPGPSPQVEYIEEFRPGHIDSEEVETKSLLGHAIRSSAHILLDATDPVPGATDGMERAYWVTHTMLTTDLKVG